MLLCPVFFGLALHQGSIDVALIEIETIPGPVMGAGLPRPDLSERWSSRLVATAAEDCLNMWRRNPRRSAEWGDENAR
jgi:hypothetical protein